MTGTRTRRSFCRNLSLGRKDEFAGGPSGALTKSSNTPTLSPAISWVQIPAPPPAPIPTSLRNMYTNLNLQKTTKLALELFI